MTTKKYSSANASVEDWIELGQSVFDIEIEGLSAVRNRLDEKFVRAVDILAACTGRVVVVGLGKSGLVGRKIAATMSSTGTPAFFLHPVEGAHGDLGAIREGDVVIAISNSGRTDELNAIVPALRSLGAKIIALTGDDQSPLSQMSDITLNSRVPKEACPMNLAPTASTTATLALGDALAVCLVRAKEFTPEDFRKYHPGGALGQQLQLQVSELMHREKLPLADISATVQEALAALDAGHMGAVLLVNNTAQLQGILTDGDIRRLARQEKLDIHAAVSTIMTANPLYAREDQSVAELLDLMESRGITVLPVLGNDKKIAGVIHLHDLLGKGSIRFTSMKM